MIPQTPDFEHIYLNCNGEGLGAAARRPDRRRAAAKAGLSARATAWIAANADAELDLRLAAAAIAWARAEPQLAKKSPAIAAQLLDSLAAIGQRAQWLTLAESPLVHQRLAGQLPLMLAELQPNGVSRRRLAAQAAQALGQGLTALLSPDGLLYARHFELSWPLLALWTDCRQLADRLAIRLYSAADKRRLCRLTRHVVQMVRPDGGLPGDVDSGGRLHVRRVAAARRKLLAAAVESHGDPATRAIAAAVRKGREPRAGQAAGRGRRTSPARPGLHSEAAATAAMRTAWAASAPRLTVLYPDGETQLELAAGRDVLLSGSWDVEIQGDGQPLLPESAWDEVGWISDADVDYLELEMRLSQGYRVQRQFIMARRDRFCFLADVVFGSRALRLDYCGRLALADGAGVRGARNTRELRLQSGKSVARALPLALSEWRGDDARGHVVTSGRSIELRQTQQGRGVHAAWFIDLDRRHDRRPLTWRQLTVGENRLRVPPDVAVGYRVMVAGRQWLFYRSLGPRANRTLLGHNLATEMLVGRFTRAGEVEKLIEIE